MSEQKIQSATDLPSDVRVGIADFLRKMEEQYGPVSIRGAVLINDKYYDYRLSFDKTVYFPNLNASTPASDKKETKMFQKGAGGLFLRADQLETFYKNPKHRETIRGLGKIFSLEVTHFPGFEPTIDFMAMSSRNYTVATLVDVSFDHTALEKNATFVKVQNSEQKANMHLNRYFKNFDHPKPGKLEASVSAHEVMKATAYLLGKFKI